MGVLTCIDVYIYIVRHYDISLVLVYCIASFFIRDVPVERNLQYLLLSS